jgi:hypothetical protein
MQGTLRATFSAARWNRIPGNPNAPRPLRDADYPWGFRRTQRATDPTAPELTPKEKGDFKEGDIFAGRSAEVFRSCVRLHVPVAPGNPKPTPDNFSLFDLDIYVTLANYPGVALVDFSQRAR